MLRLLLILFLVLIFPKIVLSKDEYFLTLRYDKVNLRQGPSNEYPVKIFYKKKFLPVLVQDHYDNYRKIIDHENNSGWIHWSQLSKKKAAFNISDNSIMFQRPSIYSKPLAMLEIGRLCLIKKCKNNWCKVRTGKYSGWVEKQNLKGRL